MRCLKRIFALAWIGAGVTVQAQDIRLIRYEETWNRDHKNRIQPASLDPLKHIPLSDRDGWHATVGGDVRMRYEYFNNPSWGLDPHDGNGFLLQRYMLHADVHLGPRFRVFAQLKSGLETGRAGGPRPVDEDRLDVHQAFLETRLWSAGSATLSLRVGRQETSLGSSRLVGIREGPNVRLSFDGARATLHRSNWSADVFALRPVETNSGSFDDSPNHAQSFWGLYVTAPVAGGKGDFYYLGLDRRQRAFEQGIAREQRHSFGARFFGRHEAWDFDYEAVGQAGSFGPASIRAWTLASNTGYSLRFLRIGLKADIASGDRNPSDQTLGTFNALFPKGAYFNQADLLGPYNVMDLHPSLTFQLTETVSITPDADFFWRQSLGDGIYDMPGNLIAPGSSAGSRYVGSDVNIAATWQITSQIGVEAHYLHFFDGPFLREISLDRPVNFVGLWTTFKF